MSGCSTRSTSARGDGEPGLGKLLRRHDARAVAELDHPRPQGDRQVGLLQAAPIRSSEPAFSTNELSKKRTLTARVFTYQPRSVKRIPPVVEMGMTTGGAVR